MNNYDLILENPVSTSALVEFLEKIFCVGRDSVGTWEQDFDKLLVIYRCRPTFGDFKQYVSICGPDVALFEEDLAKAAAEFFDMRIMISDDSLSSYSMRMVDSCGVVTDVTLRAVDEEYAFYLKTDLPDPWAKALGWLDD